MISPLTSSAAEPQAVFSWEAQTFVPPLYEGHVLANDATPIWVALAVIENQKFADFNNQNIKWFVDGAPYREGVGSSSIIIPQEFTKPPVATVSVLIEKYRGATTSLAATTTIPIIAPLVRAEAPYPNRGVAIGIIELRALPYFFTASSLSDFTFEWTANDTPGTLSKSQGDPSDANLFLLTIQESLRGRMARIAVGAVSNGIRPTDTFNLSIQ